MKIFLKVELPVSLIRKEVNSLCVWGRLEEIQLNSPVEAVWRKEGRRCHWGGEHFQQGTETVLGVVTAAKPRALLAQRAQRWGRLEPHGVRRRLDNRPRNLSKSSQQPARESERMHSSSKRIPGASMTSFWIVTKYKPLGKGRNPQHWLTFGISLGQEDPLQEGMVTHSIILAWRIPWTEESGGLPSMGSQRVRQDWSDLTLLHASHCQATAALPTPWEGAWSQVSLDLEN